jgi:hypothetical protein
MIERPAKRLSATTKFYAGFCVVVVLVVALAFYVGYRAGIGHAHAATRSSDAS